MAGTPMSDVLLGAYRLQDLLGEGAMGQVWRAVGPTGPVAVKLVGGRVPGTGGVSAQLLRAEIQLAALLDHAHVARVVDAGTVSVDDAGGAPVLLEAGAPWVAMELAGAPLFQVPPSTVAGVVDVLSAVLGALAHAHAHDVVHRDVKPDNVLQHPDPTRRWVLGDFGLATARAALHAATQGGSRGYAAPEQRRRQRYLQGPWTDLYAVGALACWLFTGEADGWPVVLPDPWLGWLAWLREDEPAIRCRHAADALVTLHELPDAEVPPLPLRAAEVAPNSRDTTLEWLGDEEPHIVPGDVPAPPPVRLAWPGFVSPRSALQVGPGLLRARTPPLVGRDAEQSVLWDALQAAEQGRGPVCVVLRAPPGTGTSRLASWVGERADETGVGMRFVARHSPLGGHGTGLHGLVATALGVHEGMDAHTLRAALEGRELPDVDGLVEFLCPDVPRARLTHPARALALVSQTVATLAGDRVPVVWLDDAQWAARPLRWVLEGLGEVGARMLVVCTVDPAVLADQPVAAERLQKLPSPTTIDVAPLQDDAQQALARSLIDLAPDVGARLAAHTGGSPTFAIQLVRAWADVGLQRDADGWRPGPDAGWPADLAGVWTARLEQVVRTCGADARPALQLAGCLGPHLDLDEWDAACAAHGLLRPPDLLDELLQAGLLVVLGRPESRTFALAHPGVGRAVHAGVPDHALTRLYRSALSALSWRSGQAQRRAVLAERAGALHDLCWSYNVLIAHALTHDLEAGMAMARSWAARTASPVARAFALCAEAKGLLLAGRLDEAGGVVHRALDIAEASGHPAARALAIARHSEVLSHAGDREGEVTLLRRALALGPEGTGPPTLGFSAVPLWCQLSVALNTLGRQGEALKATAEAIRVAAIPDQECFALVHRADLLVMAGRMGEARAALDRVAELGASLSIDSVRLQLMGWVAAHDDDLVAARAHVERSVRLREWAGLASPHGHGQLAELDLAEGHLDAAEVRLEHLHDGTGERGWVVALRAALAAHHGRVGAVTQALPVLEDTGPRLCRADRPAAALDALGRPDLAARWRAAVRERIGVSVS